MAEIVSKNITPTDSRISRQRREERFEHKAFTFWLTGLSGSGKSTLAGALEKRLHEMGYLTYLLDGDNVRHGLNKDLGFSDEDRVENIRRIGEMAHLFVDGGTIVLSAFISPFKEERQLVRNLLEKDEFIEVFLDTPLTVCEERDVKGLYQKARNGEIKNFTGIDSEYQVPESPEISIQTHTMTLDESVDQIVAYLCTKGILK